MKRLRQLLLTLLVASLPGGTLLSGAEQGQDDLLILGARVLDGTGNPWFRADVAIRDGRIAAIGRLDRRQAVQVIDATGLYLAPGFIDVHSHAGPALATAELSDGLPLQAQGVTTVVVNPDGGGAVDLRDQRRRLLEHGLGVNVAQLVPHGSIRRQILGMVERAPTASELEEMKGLVRAGMEAGGFGLSSGLYYAPGSYATTGEVIALARVAGRMGGLYTSHIRDEADYGIGVVAAVEEVVRISREAQIPSIVSHIKALGPRVWGFSEVIVRRIESARAEGLEVYADQYPYVASGTSIGGALVPRWAQAGGRDALRRRLASSSDRARIRSEMVENLKRRGGAERLQFRSFPPDPSVEGQTLAQVAAGRAMEPVDLAMEMAGIGGAGLVSFNMDPADVQRFMRQPWTMTCSDGGLVPMGDGVPHPRNYGSFPRKLARFAVGRSILSLEAAVRSMTWLPASVFGLQDRGMVREGAVADLVLFDLERINDPATYERPHQLAEGVIYLMLKGKLVIAAGRPSGGRPGTVLEGPASR